MPENLKRKNFPFCGRLIVLESVGNRGLPNMQQVYDGMIAINFPAMPETIELARRTDYMVFTNPAFPDGIHQYKGTAPLEIPVSFSLHSFDREYCPKGALSLLSLAADLQALVLPFGPDDVVVNVGKKEQEKPSKDPGNPKDTKEPNDDASIQAKAAEETTITGDLKGSYNIYPPATCYLELIITDRELPGVACVGYVKDVKVVLKGPWMRGPGISQNLPSAGEFSFTFVHHPGHGNAYNFGKNRYDDQGERQAYANKVKNRLFNTRDLLTHANYHGFNDPLAGS